MTQSGIRLWQGSWSPEGTLWLWAEEVNDATPTSALLHPRSLSEAEVQETKDALELDVATVEVIEVLLPSDEQGPLCSSRLPLPGADERTATLGLRPWQVHAIGLDPIDTVNFLTSQPAELPAGARFDRSIDFWREAIKLLLELLSRGRFIPGLEQRGLQWHSVWKLRIQDAIDIAREQILVECMPPVCGAIRFRDALPAGAATLESFLGTTADTLIRSFLSRYPLTEGITPKSTTRQALLSFNWLESLSAKHARVDAPDYELLPFEQRIRTWAGSSDNNRTTPPLNLHFHLRPPIDDEEVWILTFYIQSALNTDKRLSLRSFWAGELGFLEQTSYSAEEIEEIVLRELGRAALVAPELCPALVPSHPIAARMSTEQAYFFLKERTSALEQQGHTLDLPSWWSNKEVQFGLELHIAEAGAPGPQSITGGFLAAKELLSYSWKIALGEERFTVDEFRSLVATNAPLVRLRGQWVELSPRKLDATLRFLDEHRAARPVTLGEALRIGLAVEHDSDIFPVVEISASGWVERLFSKQLQEIPQLSEPSGFTGTLRTYQREGLSWLAFTTDVGVGACLADDMGLGKTIQLLALLLEEKNRASSRGVSPLPTLLVVPMSILANWQEEAERFAPALRMYMHHGQQRASGSHFTNIVKASDVIVTTYSLLHRDEHLFSSILWGRIVLDEAQNIKNIEAKQTQAVRRLVNTVLGQEIPAHRIALTGTPLENHLEELWSIFDYLNPGFLGTITEFRTRFVVPIERYRNKQASEALGRLIQPFILRRLKTDPAVISDLPEKLEMEVHTGLTEEQAALYQSVVEEMLPQVAEASGIHQKGLVLSTISKLKQICNHPALYLKTPGPLAGRSAKLNRLEEILEVVLAEGDRVLLFTQYAQMGHLLKPYLQERFDVEVLFLHGGLSKKARDQLLVRFRSEDAPPIFILSLKAGGFGLNLTEANQVIHFDQWWNPAVQEQATDRAYRIGQKRTVQVRTFICRGTLEEKIAAMLHQKREIANEVVGSSKNAITQLSLSELKALLELRYTDIPPASEEG